MKELWIQKTVWRRYLIKDDDVEEVGAMIKGDPSAVIAEIIGDDFDKNDKVEYDEEFPILPLNYHFGKSNDTDESEETTKGE